jgi:predicted RNA-binding Zn-ribbon protein involved in translation (DUF1610 family)
MNPEKKESIAREYMSGKRAVFISRDLGIPVRTVYHNLREKLGDLRAIDSVDVVKSRGKILRPEPRDWDRIREYSNNHNRNDTIDRFKLKRHEVYIGIRVGAIKRMSHTLAEVAIRDSPYGRSCIRKRILKDNLIPYKCAICGMDPVWNGKPLSLRLDHINGINNDHRMENMRFVCPNCDSQLPTFCSKNWENLRQSGRLKSKNGCRPVCLSVKQVSQ